MIDLRFYGGDPPVPMAHSPITRDFAERFAEEWVAARTAHNLPRILSHYERSPVETFEIGETGRVVRAAAQYA